MTAATLHIEVRRDNYVHSTGTKFYEMIQFHNYDHGTGVLVKRWGKNGARGQIKVEIYGNIPTAEKAVAAEHRVRINRGYAKDAYGTPAPIYLEQLGEKPAINVVTKAVFDHYGVGNAEKVLEALGIVSFDVDSSGDTVIQAPLHVSDDPNWGSW
jgi:predicted DNA-binding WGR domain protein